MPLKVTTQFNGSALQVHMQGAIDELTHLETLIGNPKSILEVNCREVDRISSHGVRLWVKYFKDLAENGVKVKFLECSPSIVQQMNTIGNLLARGELVSVCAPYRCVNCSSSFNVVYSLDQLKSMKSKPYPQKCPKCQNNAIFDDLESEYFDFVQHL